MSSAAPVGVILSPRQSLPSAVSAGRRLTHFSKTEKSGGQIRKPPPLRVASPSARGSPVAPPGSRRNTRSWESLSVLGEGGRNVLLSFSFFFLHKQRKEKKKQSYKEQGEGCLPADCQINIPLSVSLLSSSVSRLQQPSDRTRLGTGQATRCEHDTSGQRVQNKSFNLPTSCSRK